MQKRSGAHGTRLRKAEKRAALGIREKRRLIQLALCMGLFLAIFLGKGIAPAGVLHSGETLLQMIRSDADFRGAFSALGETLSGGGSVTQGLGDLAKEVFGAGTQAREETRTVPGLDSFAVKAVTRELAQLPTQETMLLRFGITAAEQGTNVGEAAGEEMAEEEKITEEVQSESTVSAMPEIPAYTGPALPAGATMEYAELGLTPTVTPVLGRLTSSYGYRDHPINGEYSFHAGVDLAAEIGTPIAAFSDGTVDFIGESEAYGLYIQIDHGNGVTTFYCHCSELYARKGDPVSAGQTIAAVGDTGNVTGPHLHLQLEMDDVLLNPIYYIETAG